MRHIATRTLTRLLCLVALQIFLVKPALEAATPYLMSTGDYSEGYGDIANWTTDFASGIGASHYLELVAGIYPAPTATTVFVSGSSGGVQKGTGTIVLLTTGSTDNTTAAAFDLLLDFSGRNAGTLSLDWASVNNSTGNRVSTFKIQTSPDGTTYTDLPGSSVSVTNNVLTTGSLVTLALPAGLNNSATARIRFYLVNGSGGTTGSRPKFSIDNVAITSTAGGAIATLGNISQPSGFIIQGDIDRVLAGFTLSATSSVDFSSVIVSGSGTALSTDLSNVRIFRDNDANGLINGGDASVSGAGVSYAASMPLTITGETGITTTRNYLIVADVAPAAIVGSDVMMSIAPGAYTTTAVTNNGSASGNQRIIAAPNTPVIALTGSVAAFSTFVGTPTFTKNYSVSGSDLSTDIVITPPAHFEITLDSTTTWTTSSGSINLTPSSGVVSNTIVYVRYNPSTTGAHSGVITHTSTGATQQDMSVSGNALASPGPLLYSTTGSTYTQDFGGLPISGSFTTPGNGPYYVGGLEVNATGATGWQFGRIGGTGTDANFGVDNGGSTTGAAYSYGTTSNTERAFGTLAGGSLVPNIGVVIRNTTADVLSRVTISFTGEQWRLGGSGLPNKLTFSYSLDGTNILNGTAEPVSQLDFSNPVSSGTTGSLDGNQAANRTAVSYTFTLNGSWLPGELLILRWNDNNDPSNDDALAIDDFSFSALPPVAPTQQDSTISFSAIATTSITASWLNGDGANHLVFVNTTNSFTDPVDGTGYPANSVYGSGQQAVYGGSGNSVTVTNLTPGTLYHFRVYGFNGTGASARYILNTATLNPNSESTTAATNPTKLAILSVNGGNPPVTNQPFSVVVQAQDNSGNPQPVVLSTTVDLSVFSGIGSISSGNTTGIITSGTTDVTITGVIYDIADFGVQLDAASSAGDVLTSGQSAPFDVVDGASQLAFDTVPATGIVNTVVSHITVDALRPDLTVDNNYTGPITIAVNSGPGTISGTLTRSAVAGTATFDDIQFSAAGSYTLSATATGLTTATSTTITITNVPSLVELVVPQYIGSKSASSTNNTRTPIAICLQFDNLVPLTAYNISIGMAQTSEAATSMGAGTIWDGAAFTGQVRNNAFTTDANGSSGPYWVFFQASGNASRFDAGNIHNLRIAYSSSPFGAGLTPNFTSTKTITALDVPTTARTPATSDDGAFLKGSSVSCISGKMVLVYDNETGTGNPLYAYQARQTTATGTNNGDLPIIIRDVFSQSGTSVVGDYAAVVPIGANNPNGVRRIEIRNTDNTISNFATDADGIWPSGANTTTLARRDVALITSSDAQFNSMTSLTATSTPVTCFGGSDGTVTAIATSTNPPFTYLWTPGGATTDVVNSLAAGNYSVVATDANGCTLSASTTITQPTAIGITGVTTPTSCTSSVGEVDITVSGGTGSYTYSWDNGSTTEDITGLAGGTYVVTVTDSAGCTATASFLVNSVNTSSPLTIIASPSSVCPGASSTITASGAVSYTWSPATDLDVTSGATLVSTPSATITYTVTGVDGSGCQSTGTVTVSVIDAPVITAGGPTTFCSGDSVTLSTSATGNYLWSPGGETTQSIVVKDAGSYTVAVDYGNGCTLTSSATTSL